MGWLVSVNVKAIALPRCRKIAQEYTLEIVERPVETHLNRTGITVWLGLVI